MLRGSNLSDDVGVRLDDSDVVYLDAALAKGCSRSWATEGDLVFTCWGTVGQIGYIDNRARFTAYVVSNKQMKMTPDPARVSGLFLYYYLSQPMMLDLVKSQAIGSSVPGFNLGQLKALTVELPRLKQQHAIVNMLGALDNKVAANAKAAECADALIRAMYTELAAEATGEITVRQLADQSKNLVDPGAADSDMQYVGLEHIPRRNLWLTTSGFAGEVTSSKMSFVRGDVLFGKLRPYFHKVVSAPSDGICSTDILVLRPRTPKMSGYVLAATSSDSTVERCTAASEGTRMPRTSWKDLGAVVVPWPGDLAAASFSDQVDAVRRRVEVGLAESHVLAGLRDVLLPQLMSGRITVNAAEHAVGEVV